jgi:hypothetical protein
MALEPIKIGWKLLAGWLNEFLSFVEKQVPIAGEGISIEPTEGGTIISVLSKTDPDIDPVTHLPAKKNPATTMGGGGGGGFPPTPDSSTPHWRLINIMGPGCVQSTIYIFASTPGVIDSGTPPGQGPDGGTGFA